MSDPLHDELRRVLHDRTPTTAADDDFLRRVHAGASRRRTRRRVAVAATAAGVAAVALTVPLGLRDAGSGPAQDPVASPSEAEPSPSEPPPEPGTPLEPTDVRVTAVSGVSESEFWVLGEGTCPSGDCAVVGRAEQGAEPDFVAAPGPAQSASTLRMAAGGTDGWLVSDDTLYATHDGARTWSDIAVPDLPAPQDVTVSADQVWVSGQDARGRTVAATAPVDSDDFVDAGLRPEVTDPGLLSEPAATRTDAGTVYGFLRDQELSTFEGTIDGAPWTSSATRPGCRGTSSLSGGGGGLWAVCATAAGFRPMVSVDKGRTWEIVEVDIGPDPLIGAIDDDRAAISTGVALYVLTGTRIDSGGRSLDIATPPDEGAGSLRYTYVGFTSERVGYLIDEDGRLSRSDNGGASWQLVDLP